MKTFGIGLALAIVASAMPASYAAQPAVQLARSTSATVAPQLYCKWLLINGTWYCIPG